MSLVVWLPLLGDTSNKGTSDLIFSTVTSNTAVDNNGKIGKCYKNDTFSAGGLVSDKKIALDSQQSMFCWFKFSSVQNPISGVVTNHSYSTNSGMSINIKYNSSTTGYIAVNTGNGSSRTFNTYYGTTLLQADTWYHGGYTYDGSTIRLYINGVCELEQAFTGMYCPEDYIAVFKWSNGHSGSYSLNGSINDVRIYNHALSLAEIKEISKGLVCHYKLDGPLGGVGPNLLKSTPKAFTPTAYCAYQLNFTENLVANQTYTLQLWDVNISHSAKSASELNVSFYWGGGSIRLCQLTGFTNGHADYLTASFTPTSAQASGSGATNAWFNVYNSVPGVSGTLNLTIGKWKLEKGSVPTHYTRTLEELGISNTLVDSSGNGFNGTLNGNCLIDLSTPRHNACINFSDNSSYGRVENLSSIGYTNSFTVSFWAIYPASTSGAMAFGFSDGYHLNLYSSGKYIYLNTGDSDQNPFRNNGERIVFTSYRGDWHHYTITGNGTTNKLYIDGVQVGTSTTYKGILGTILNFNGLDSSSSYKINNKISDFRIYATVLSVEDIKKLYNSPVAISKNGTMITNGDFIEE